MNAKRLKNITAKSLLVLVLVLLFPPAFLLRAQPVPGQKDKNLAERLGYSANSRLLVIHAADFGMTHSVDAAIEEALEKHWVTSTSILVPCPWFPEVAQWAKAHPDADLGIHLALNSEWTPFRWGPVSPVDKVSSLLDDEGYLPLVEETVLAKARPKEAERELRSQIDRAVAAGIRIT